MKPSAERVLDALWRALPDRSEAQLYTILDGARDRRIFAALSRPGLISRCLYRGELSSELAEAAPYLLRLERDENFANWLIETGWGKSWGVFVVSPAAIDDLRRHFRRFLMVHDEHAKPLYFRYYDPRVLRIFLPTCAAEELAVIFGPVESYFAENEAGDGLLKYVFSGGKLGASAQPLTTPPAA